MSPRVGLIGGAGIAALPGFVREGEERLETPWGPPSGAYLTGSVGGVPVAILSRNGPGYRVPPSALNDRANVWGFRRLGCDALLSAWTGTSLDAAVLPGHAVVPDQLIDMTRRRRSSFFDEEGVAHVSMARPVCPHLAGLLAEGCRRLEIPVRDGATSCCVEGPQSPTGAEARLYRSWGAGVVGMTDAPEAKLAREAETCYASVAFVTDAAPDSSETQEAELEMDQVIEILKTNARNAGALLAAVVARVDAARGCGCRAALGAGLVTLAPDVSPETRERLALLTGRYWK